VKTSGNRLSRLAWSDLYCENQEVLYLQLVVVVTGEDPVN
jgi:hypothetical protein